MKTTILLSEGILHSQIFIYPTKDQKARFTFSYELENGHYVISIHSHPSYKDRNDASNIAHWLPYYKSPIGRKICFTTGKEPKTLQKAKDFSMYWAELTWTYIKTGVTIDDQLLSRN